MTALTAALIAFTFSYAATVAVCDVLDLATDYLGKE